MDFSQAKLKFDEEYRSKDTLSKSLTTVDGKFIENIKIKDVHNEPNEEYYKWQFIYSMIQSDKVPSRDYIGAEIYFPKGNINSAPIRIDAVIFSSIDWIDYYKDYRENKNVDALQKLRKLAIGVIEFKRNDKTIEQVFSSQVRAAIKEPDSQFVLGIYYDTGRLFLFKKVLDEITRFDNTKSFPTSQRVLERFQLEITDPYFMIPSLGDMVKIIKQGNSFNYNQLRLEDLDTVYTIHDENIKTALSNILKALDSVSLYNEEGYLHLIQLIAMKIYDEKQRETYGGYLKFYINPDEQFKGNLNDKMVQAFVTRMTDLYNEAKTYYSNILNENRIYWTQEKHIVIAMEIVKQFQTYSFIKSRKSDLYQLVFYNFATKFKKDENAQFLTPLPIIDFMVRIINPRRAETVCDPCCGIADFLSLSYINSQMKLADCNLYGFDNDYNMTVLAQLNMLLNGDGNAVIRHMPDKGSITQKLTTLKKVVRLDSNLHENGNWDKWFDGTELMKYDVILTNPPFGKGRSLDLSKAQDIECAKLYELYHLYTETNPKAGLDLGVVFLENAVRSLKVNGRFAIVLSNAIMSNNTWPFVREWLLKKIRVVAAFDLPSNIFAETGVNTTILVGYKPSEARLKALKESNYPIFAREIENVGYIKRTSQRNVVFDKDYLLDQNTFETIIDKSGESVLNEDFSRILYEFKEWCITQETEIKKLFLE